MTFTQIGATPHKACCHTQDRPGCPHCANYASVIAGGSQGGRTVQTSTATK